MDTDRPRALAALITNCVLAFTGVTFGYWLCYERPVAYVAFVSEDCWVEFATFVGFLLASVAIFVLAARDRSYRRLGWLGLAAGALVVAGEEISWGQRMFGVASPEVFQAHNNQSELNLHNFVGPRHYSAFIGPAILFFAVILPFVPRASRRLARLYERFGVPAVPGRAQPLFLLAALILYSSVVLVLPETMEFMELFLGTALAVMSVDLLVRSWGGKRAGRTAVTLAALSTVAVIWIMTAPLVHWLGRPSHRNALNKYAASRFPAEGMWRQSEEVFRYLRSHPEVQQDDTVLNQAIVYRRTGREAEADQILRNALADERERQRNEPGDPAPWRAAGRILRLLGEAGSAQEALETAVAIDAKRLESSTGGSQEWNVHWSLAKTLHAMGDHDGAVEEVVKAKDLAPDAPTREEINHWFAWEERRPSLVEGGATDDGISGPVAVLAR